MNKLLLLVFCLLIISTSCTKQQVSQGSPVYTFTNAFDRRVKFDIYQTREDYDQCSNRMRQYIIEPDASQKIPFEAVKTYWVDWYTDDYVQNNWATDASAAAFYQPFPLAGLGIADGDDEITLRCRTTGLPRAVLLKDGNLFSSWKVNIDNIPSLAGAHVFTFKRDFSGQYSFTPVSGPTQITPVTFSLFQLTPTSFRMKVRDSLSVQISEIYFNENPSSFPRFGRDTLMINFRGKGYYDYHVAERQ